METLELRRTAVTKALSRLDDSLQKLHSKEFELVYTELRDSTIQRFEFCTDTLWKFLKYTYKQILKYL